MRRLAPARTARAASHLCTWNHPPVQRPPGGPRTSRRPATYYASRGRMRNPGTAAVLSLIIPGVGQIYNGKILRGIFWLIVTPGFWLGTGGMFGWVCHLISAFTAYYYASKHP